MVRCSVGRTREGKGGEATGELRVQISRSTQHILETRETTKHVRKGEHRVIKTIANSQ